jgi:hypothetical protein
MLPGPAAGEIQLVTPCTAAPAAPEDGARQQSNPGIATGRICSVLTCTPMQGVRPVLFPALVAAAARSETPTEASHKDAVPSDCTWNEPWPPLLGRGGRRSTPWRGLCPTPCGARRHRHPEAPRLRPKLDGKYAVVWVRFDGRLPGCVRSDSSTGRDRVREGAEAVSRLEGSCQSV